MRLVFVSIDMPNLSTNAGGLYADMLRELCNRNYKITVIAPSINDGFSGLRNEGDFRVVRVPLAPFIGDIPFYKKGLRILSMTGKYKTAYKKYLGQESFDVVMMATPPATLVDVIKLIKEQSGAKFYLLLRDIHPECLNRKVVSPQILNRPDVYGECKKPFGVNLFVQKLLHKKSQSLYKTADWIACMSPGNQKYLKQIAPYVDDNKNVLLPNWYKFEDTGKVVDDSIRSKYGLQEKFIAIFGGTIGQAQAVWNIATLAKHNLDKKDVVFLIVGRGVKKKVLEEMAQKDNLINMKFLSFMPREDYEQILMLADVGIISIDEKYKVPTCPSKVIGYMACSKPVLAMFNTGNDYGDYYIDKAKCGLWSAGLDNEKMFANFDWFYNHPVERKELGKNGFDYFKNHFSVEVVCDNLCKQLENG